MLYQHGGEGTGSYKGKGSSSKLKQHGGEGSGSGKSSGGVKLFNPSKAEYSGPGRHLKTVSYSMKKKGNSKMSY